MMSCSTSPSDHPPLALYTDYTDLFSSQQLLAVPEIWLDIKFIFFHRNHNFLLCSQRQWRKTNLLRTKISAEIRVSQHMLLYLGDNFLQLLIVTLRSQMY